VFCARNGRSAKQERIRRRLVGVLITGRNTGPWEKLPGNFKKFLVGRGQET
jgi:hypothetical protein